MSHRIWPVFLVAVLVASVLFPLSGCGSEDEDARHKLDSALTDLIDTEKRGEAESFAQSARIDLVDGAVEVVIESKPGQFEVAIKAAAKHGTVVGLTESVEHLSALVPITSLTALAREGSIRLIRLPEKPSPQ